MLFYFQLKEVETMKPMKKCNEVNCRNLIPFDQSYCPKHLHKKREQYDQWREREEPHLRRVYHSNRWRTLRKHALMRDEYLCQSCLSQGRYTEASVVDHIIEIRDDISQAYNIENLQSLCPACHNRKTSEEKKKRGKPPI